MYSIIQGIPVSVDSPLSQEQISQLVSEMRKAWIWEGRSIGKIEINSIDEMLHVYIYEPPSVKVIPKI
ncbi:hypothetical protein SRRS_31190 [Sporomusa rhizae]|uniref:hypothetical protein n=1 Tax=Sporomusa rhizae TaxID=357999 RepID=UPI003529FE72